jgi:hypothetical protein
MAQLKNVVEPFGEVNVYPEAGKVRVVATILMEPRREGTQTGIALDGSGSMAGLYGAESQGGFFAGLLGKKKPKTNEITPVAQKVCAHLARKLDADGGTTCIYWAVGPAAARSKSSATLPPNRRSSTISANPRTSAPARSFCPR